MQVLLSYHQKFKKKKKKLNDVLQALGLTTENIPVKVEFTKSSDSSRMQAQI